MDVKDLLAKSDKREYNQKKQTIIEHTEMVIALMEKVLDNPIYSKEFKFILLIVVLCHDLGKINSIMQEKLDINSQIDSLDDKAEIKKLKELINKNNITRHNILSGAFIKEILDKINLTIISNNFDITEDELRDLIYKAVILHHGSFEDYMTIDESKIQEDIYNYIDEEIFSKFKYNTKEVEEFIINNLSENKEFTKSIEELRKYSLSKESLDYEFINHLNEHFVKESKEKQYKIYNLYIYLKGLLNLVDHGASSQEKINNYYNQYSDEEIDFKLKEMIRDKIELNNKVKKNIDDINFNSFQEKIRALKDKNVLTIAFTGSGKTVADYRKSFKKKFYLVPNKISAEGFYRDSIFKNDEIGIIHGDINLYAESNFKEKRKDNDLILTERDVNLAMNFCNPYIIATVDQILLSMFKYEGYEKAFAAIIGADITIDEIHLLTPRMFLILLYFIEFTVKYFQVKFHLMTATMPKAYLEMMKEFGFSITDKEELEDNSITFITSNKDEINEGKDEENKINLKVDLDENKVYEIVTKSIKNKERILIVKNTIKESIEIYNRLKDEFEQNGIKANISLLHSRFKVKDKQEKFTEILGSKGDIWIATQSVEIALDIDFKNQISDLATMECLIQRMGRNNRHNNFDYGRFYVLKDKEDVYDKKLKKETLKLLKKHLKENKDGTLTLSQRKALLDSYYGEKVVEKYFQEEFQKSRNDIKEIYGLMTEDFTAEDLIFNFEPYLNLVDNKKKAAKLFRNINGTAKIIMEDDYKRIINKQEDKKEIRREIGLQSIPLSAGIYMKMKKLNLIEYKKGYEILKENQIFKYSKEKGLEDTTIGKDIKEDID